MITGISAAERVEATTALLVVAAIDAGYAVSGDMRVSETDAAHLLGLTPGHLKNLRQEGRGPISYRASVGGCRVSYRLSDLSAWIEGAREEVFLNDR